MPGNGAEIYKTCREAAGLTQEQASEGLNCSVRSLARYESGEQHVPDDIAYQMVVLYDSQLLAVQHLRLVSHVAADLLPPVAVLDLPRAAIRIINQVRRFAERHRERELLDIAEDGVISPEERPLFDEIMDELHELVQAIMELGLSEEGDGDHGKRKRGLPGQPGARSGGVPRPGDHYPKGTGRMAAHGQQNRQSHVSDEGRRDKGRHLLDLRGQPGPRHVVGKKTNAPRRQPQGVRVQGLARKSENDSKVILPHFARKCKPTTTIREGVTLL